MKESALMASTAKRLTVVTPPRESKARPRPRPKPGVLTPQVVAKCLGSVCVAVLVLSVVHCTEAICIVTGSHWTLAGLMAIGIDAGMVMCEMGELVSEDRRIQVYSRVGVVLGIVASMVLNAIAFTNHSPKGMLIPAALLGVAIPGLVFIFGRVAGLLYRSK